MDILNANRIADFQKVLSSIYNKKNETRNPEYIYSYLARNTAYLSRSVLRNGDTKTFYIKTISWLLAFSNSVSIDLEDAFIRKFPKACPYCLSSPCQCVQNHKQPATKLAAYKVREELQRRYEGVIGYYPNIFGIDEAINIIGEIYPSNKIVWSVHGSFYHFTRIYEELGEIHEAYTSFQKDSTRKINLEEELADFTAWLLSAWEIEMKGVSLKDTIINYYSNGCPVCRKSECECSDYSDRKEAIIDTDSLEELKNQIIELNTLNDVKHDEIIELLKSIDSALQTKSTTDAKRALTQAKETLSDVSNISNSVATIGDNYTKISTVAASIYNFADKIISSL